jgi:hypothetical protein
VRPRNLPLHRLVAAAAQVNCPDVPHDALEQECAPVAPNARFFDFRLNARAPRSTVVRTTHLEDSRSRLLPPKPSCMSPSLIFLISSLAPRFRSLAQAHFQLRNLVWATSRADVYLSSEGSLLHWDALRQRSRRALDLERAPHGLGRVQVSTMAAHAGAGLLAAGGFAGELIVAPLRERCSRGGGGGGGQEGGAGGAAGGGGGGGGGGGARGGPSWRAGPGGGVGGGAGGAGGGAAAAVAAAAGGGEGGVLHAARITQDENGITNAIELTPGGPCGGAAAVVASNNDAHVRVFDAAAMRLSSAFRFPWAVNCTALSPCGALAAVVGDHPTATLLDLRSGAHVASLAGHLDFSFAAAWHPAGRLVATGSQDTTARVWDVRHTAHALAVIKGRMAAIRSLRFSPDGALLALAEAADFVHIASCGGPDALARAQLIDLFGEVAGVSFSPDGDALFVGVADMTYGSLLEYERAAPRRARYLPL